ncbi:MAG: phosphatase PAP2 family protein [Acetobacteraceae bacterium]|nr:phosphatase PAP2 family protein [Acetobacteraceae bacterium]
MTFLTDFADQAVILPLVLAVAGALAAQGWRRGAVVWLCVLFATFATLLSLKLAFLACSPLFGPMDIRSPSGHVAAASVVSGGLAALLLRRRAPILPIAAMAALIIGVSRIVLGAHSLPEVAVGALVGLLGALALLRLAGQAPELRNGRLVATVIIIATIFHGLHLPAEAAIRHTAIRASLLLPACHQKEPL